MSEPTSFLITELTGEQRSLELKARALPYKGYALEGEQRATDTWYPGNPTASLQMLGTKESPTSVNGQWKNRFIMPVTEDGTRSSNPENALFNGAQVRDVSELINAVEQLRLSGQLLRVEWNGTIREGVLKRFRQNWLTTDDLEWSMEFLWASRGEPVTPVTVPVGPAADTYATQARSIGEGIKDFIDHPPFLVASEFMNTIRAYSNTIMDGVQSVEDLAIQTVAEVVTPIQAAQQTLAVMESIGAAADGIVTTVESTVARSIISTVDITETSYGDVLAAETYMREFKTRSRELEALSAEQGDRFKKMVDQEDLLAAFVAVEGTDLRDVSTKFYNTPDQWRTILRYNSFTSSKLHAGELVLVPKIDFIDRGD